MVNESNFSVSSLKRSAIKNQEDIIPIVIPITAHISPSIRDISERFYINNRYLTHKEIKKIVNESAEFAKASPEPELDELYTDIYA